VGPTGFEPATTFSHWWEVPNLLLRAPGYAECYPRWGFGVKQHFLQTGSLPVGLNRRRDPRHCRHTLVLLEAECSQPLAAAARAFPPRLPRFFRSASESSCHCLSWKSSNKARTILRLATLSTLQMATAGPCVERIQIRFYRPFPQTARTVSTSASPEAKKNHLTGQSVTSATNKTMAN